MSNIKEKLAQLTTHGFELRGQAYLRQAWDLFKRDPGVYIVFTVLFVSILAASSLIPMSQLLIATPLAAGFYIVAKKQLMGESYQFKDFFDGFQLFVPLVMAGVITSILVSVGILCLLLPGIYLVVSYSYTNFFILEHQMSPWQAMEASRKLLTKQWWDFLAFGLLLGLVNFVGILCLGVGIFVTIPVTILAVYISFRDVIGTVEETGADFVEENLFN